jgi:hypothetical protein
MPAAYPIVVKSKALNVYNADESKSARIEIATGSAGEELVIAHDDGLLPVYIPGPLIVLDGAVKVNVAQKLASHSTSLATDKAAATTARSAISTALTAEASRAAAAEFGLTTNLDLEIARAKLSEGFNTSAIAAETAARVTAVQSVSTGLASELNARAAADTIHTESIGSNASAIATQGEAIVDLQDQISANLQAAEEGVTLAITRLDSEVSRAEGAERQLFDRIGFEEVARADALGILEADGARNLDAERVRAEGAEAGLQAQISSILSNTDAVALNSLAELVTEFSANGNSFTESLQTENERAVGIEDDLRARIADLEAAINALQSQAAPGDGGVNEDAEAEA